MRNAELRGLLCGVLIGNLNASTLVIATSAGFVRGFLCHCSYSLFKKVITLKKGSDTRQISANG
jgi:hypothetical protein